MRIHDAHFLRRLFREFGRRTMTNGTTLARFDIEVSRGRMALDDIRLDVFDEAGRHRVTLGLHWLRGVTVLYADQSNTALWGVNDSDDLQSRLTHLVFRLCKRHGVIDAKGRMALEDREATA